MTLRDDVIFLGFLYQWWAYRADRTRPNEYGFKYEDAEEVKEVNGGEDEKNKEKEN